MIPQDTILVSMDVTSLYTNIPQQEGIQTVCSAYENFYNNNPPIPSHYFKEMLSLILKQNSFKFKTHGTAMGTKMAVAFPNIFMAEIETNLLNQSRIKPIAWKRYIDDVFSLWDTKKENLDIFITQANTYHPTIKFIRASNDQFVVKCIIIPQLMKINVIKAFSGVFQCCWENIICSFFPARHTRATQPAR